MYCNNKSAMATAKNHVYHSKTKYIAIKNHFVRETIEEGELELKFRILEEHVANIFPKLLSNEKFHQLEEALGIQK